MPLQTRILIGALLLSGALAAQKTPQIPDDVIYEPDQVYSKVRDNLAVDIVRPKNASGKLPTILMVHGGGFRAGTRQSYTPLAIKLAQHGYVAATASYGLAPQNPYPAAVYDVKAAVRFLRANAAKYGIDPDRIGAMGGSAGGHLVLMLGVTQGVAMFEGDGGNKNFSSNVKCVVNYYGPSDLTKSCGKSVDACEVLPLFLGGDVDHERAKYILASPLSWITPAAVPILTLHGTVDRYVNFEQAVWLTDRLKQVGVETKLVPFEGADHGLKGEPGQQADKLMMAFFDQHLKN